MFSQIQCPMNKQAKLLCIRQSCQRSPFICGLNCDCSLIHTQLCQIKNIQQLTNDIAKVINFQWLVIFSNVLKADGIELAGRVALQTHAPPRNGRFVLTFDNIPFHKKAQVGMKLSKVNGCVGVGIFLKDTLVGKNFCYEPQSHYMGHGAYMILSNGYKYSHSQQLENFKEVNKFQMVEGTIITLKLQNGLLTFYNGSQYAYLKVPPLGQIHFGAYLYAQGDSVETIIRK